MNYAQAIEFLYSLQMFGARFGLETPRRLAALAGNPHEGLRFIHVAGTNGKGSTCAFLESIYRHAGLRVGLYTSPHLVRFGERIQVNRQAIPEEDIARLMGELRSYLGEFSEADHPTFFEVVTVLALRWFAEQRCDLVIWETGLGGRLDATNIVTPLASVITNVQFDHTQWLGDTLAKIAMEKAGIIKPGVPVITTATEPEVLAVIEETAVRFGAPLVKVNPDATDVSVSALPMLPLLGDHQRTNAALACAVVKTLRPVIEAADESVERGLAATRWPGRLQVERLPDGRTVLLDGAHNPAGAETLRAALRQHFPDAQPTLILGQMRDKDWSAACRTLAPLASRILTVPVSTPRTLSAAELAEACRAVNPRATVTACDSFSAAWEKARGDSFVIITGSLYLVGEALSALGLADEMAGERGLNEWTTTGGKTKAAAQRLPDGG